MADNSIDSGQTVEPRIIRILRKIALLRESWVGMIGAGLVLFWVLVALLADLIAPFDPLATILPYATPGTLDEATGKVFWLGTDHIGRDILSRIIHGSRTVLIWSVVATASAYVTGVFMGLAAGYLRGWWDTVLSFIGDVVLAFPVLVLYIVMITSLKAPLEGFFAERGLDISVAPINIIIAVTFASAPGIMRIVRGQMLDLRTRDYVAAAQTRGEHPFYIMLVELLPNARGPLIVDLCVRLGYVTITIGVLGFLGLGLPPPNPDWGGMINETRRMAMFAPHMVVYPCLAISSLVLGLNLLADGLREISLRD